MNSQEDGSVLIPITLKWGKTMYTKQISVIPGSDVQDLKRKIQAITNVPPKQQKLLSKCWKGILKDNVSLPEVLSLPKGKDALLVTLIGSAGVLVDTPVKERPRLVEDITPQEREAERQLLVQEADCDIVALQRVPGERNDGKMETYNYNRLVTGLPQQQIEDKLRARRETSDSRALIGEVAMTMGLELRRAYVNSLAVLDDGTLISGLDDGHVQMWRRGELVNDVIHEGNQNGGVDKVVSFPVSGIGVDSPAFVTGGRGSIKIWTDEGNCLLRLTSPQGTTPLSLVTGSIPENNGNSNINYLACCFRVTYQSNPNQFRLAPQDEEGRRRRALAEEQQYHIQQHLNRTSKCVNFWFYDKNSPASFGDGIIRPPNGENTASVKELASSSEMLICGDEWGGLRIMEVSVDRTSGQLNFRQSAFHQLQCQEFDCTISCMKFVQGNLLAVAYDYLQDPREEGTRLLSSATPIQVTRPRAVVLIDLDRTAIKAVLDAHTDTVKCICPLPSGDLLTAGGKMDATIQVWEASVLSTVLRHDNQEEVADVPVLSKAKKLKEPGYVFDLKVLPDSKPGSSFYAVATARYNVIKIVI